MATADKQITFTVATQPASTLGTAAAALSSGQWGSLTTTGISQALITRGDSDSIISYCKNAQWDPNLKRIYFYGSTHGGSHLKRMIRYDDSNNTWSADLDGSPESDGADSHGYWHFALKPSDGRQFIRHYNSGTCSSRLPAGSFSGIASLPGSEFADWNVANALVYFPELNSGAGGLIFAATNVYASNSTFTSWSQLATGLNISYHNFAVYNIEDHRVYFGGGNAGNSMWRVDSAGTIITRAAAPFSVGADGSGGQGGVFRGTTGKMFAISTAGVIREYDSAANTWLAQSSTLPFTPSQNHYFGAACDVYGVVAFMYISGGLTPSTTMHIWKH